MSHDDVTQHIPGEDESSNIGQNAITQTESSAAEPMALDSILAPMPTAEVEAPPAEPMAVDTILTAPQGEETQQRHSASILDSQKPRESALENEEGIESVNPTTAEEKQSPTPEGTSTDATRPMDKVKKDANGQRIINISDLCQIGSADPPEPKTKPSHAAMSAETYAQIDYLYKHEYARGIDALLETSWYATHGHAQLRRDTKLCEHFAGVLDLFANTPGRDYDGLRKLPSAESALVWALMRMPRSATSFTSTSTSSGTNAAAGEAPASTTSPTNESNNDTTATATTTMPSSSSSSSDNAFTNLLPPTARTTPQDLELDTVLRRLLIFETLLTCKTLPTNPLSPSATGSYAIPTIATYHQTRFWQALGFFVSLPQAPTTGPLAGASASASANATVAPPQHAQIEQNLTTLRAMLEEKENRDVLYSMAVVRYRCLLAKWYTLDAESVDGADEKGLGVVVAKRFVEDVASGVGTNQVVMRVCGMAARSWQLLK